MTTANLRRLSEKWDAIVAVANRSWQNNWEDLAIFFAYPTQICRLIYTTNSVEGYRRQQRKVAKSKRSQAVFPSQSGYPQKVTMPIHNWPLILNQRVICFKGRLVI